jgi:8-amino-7-oxononanoate synthase
MCRPADNVTLRRLQQELTALESQSQLRRLDAITGVNLSSNDYLGFSTDPRIKVALQDHLTRFDQISSTGSRLLSGNSVWWEQTESEFAEFIGSEAALFFGSGYAANVGLLSAVLRPEDFVFSDSSNHASLIDGVRLSRARRVIVPHLDLDFLEDAFRQNEDQVGERFIVVESVFSMEGDRAPLCDLAALADRYDASLIVDEAHATGVFGPQGRGLVAETGRFPSLLATIHTCGKALAAAGAFVTCSETLKQYLVNRARTFIFSTALPPFVAAQIRAAVRLVRQADAERECLERLAHRLRRRLCDAGFDVGPSSSQIIPVILGSNYCALNFARELAREGFAAKAIRPPTVPPGTARLRISLTANLSMETVEDLSASMIAARERMSAAELLPGR